MLPVVYKAGAVEVVCVKAGRLYKSLKHWNKIIVAKM